MHPRWRVACCATLLLASAVACGDSEEGGGESSGATSATSTTGPPSTGRPIVVDTDLAVDDLVALAFLLSSTEAEVRAVTVSGTGEVRCPQGLAVIRGLLAVTGDDDVPVACGRSAPLAGDRAFPDAWRDSADDAYGLDLPAAPSSPPEDRDAVDLLTEALEPGGVTMLTLGPLTNLAEAFRSEPELASQVGSVVVMGGAVDVPGNVFGEVLGEGGQTSDAEWNLYVDPTAAAEVVASGAPIVLVGLDATNQVPITADFLEVLGVNAHTDAAILVDTALDQNPSVSSGEAYFWDPLAAAVVLDPDVVTIEEARIDVVTDEGPDSGRTVRSDDGHTVSLAVGADVGTFEELFLRTLDGLEPGELLAAPTPPVGEGVIRFDGAACSYEGPASVPAGRMRFTFDTSEPGWSGAVVHMTGELTIQEVLAWIEANPASQEAPPGVDAATIVQGGGAAFVDVAPPTMALACAGDDPIPLAGGSFVVE